MPSEFVSEPLHPVAETLDSTGMARGEPGLPGRFVWRDEEYAVEEVIEAWKTTSGCSHGSGETYVRRHWWRVRVTGGTELKVYFERQARSVRQRKVRWWVHSVESR